VILTGRFLRCSAIVIGRAFRAAQIRDGARAMRPIRKISSGFATQSSLMLASFIILPPGFIGDELAEIGARAAKRHAIIR
jgi:hypothetical protein